MFTKQIYLEFADMKCIQSILALFNLVCYRVVKVSTFGPFWDIIAIKYIKNLVYIVKLRNCNKKLFTCV